MLNKLIEHDILLVNMKGCAYVARPTKDGLDYFPLDVDTFEDEKIEAIAGEFGIKGELAVIKLLCAVYKKGYFIVWNDLTKATLLKRLPGVSKELLDHIVIRLVTWGFFNEDLFNSAKVLTSENIQAVYFEATKRRKSPKPSKYLINGSNNNSSSVVNANINTQSKVKESKVNKSKVNNKKQEKDFVEELSSSQQFIEHPFGSDKLGELIAYYSKNVSPATPINITDLEYDLNDFNGDLELMKDAVNICARENKRTYNYFSGILKRWRATGVKTHDDYLDSERKWQEEKLSASKQTYRQPVRQEMLPDWVDNPIPEQKLSAEKQLELEKQLAETLGITLDELHEQQKENGL